MKKNNLTEIKSLDTTSLRAKAKSLRIALAEGVMDKNMNKQKDLRTNHKNKKDLAQVLTILRQKELISKLETEKGATE